jgi:hypothetical protein
VATGIEQCRVAPVSKSKRLADPAPARLRADLYAEILSRLCDADHALLEVALQARGHELYDREGTRLGTVAAVLIDRETARPQWLALEREADGQLIGVPAACLEPINSNFRIPLRADRIRSAPGVALGGLSAQLERALCRHYGLPLTRGGSRRTERRATSSRAFQDPGGTGQVGWLPGPRGD